MMSMSRLLKPLGLGVFMLLAPTGAYADLQSAYQMYQSGDVIGAVTEWEELAKSGNADALFNLGRVYHFGEGIPVDLSAAEYFYRRAAESGHLDAQSNLATLYYYEEGDLHRPGDAIRWWRTAARQGHAPSQYMLAILHFSGENVPQDNIQAFAWIVLAADAGVIPALDAKEVIRRNLTLNEIAQGRLLAQGLVDLPATPSNRAYLIPTPDFQMPNPTIAPPAPLAPPEPNAPPEAATLSADRTPPTPSTPPEPPTAEVGQIARTTITVNGEADTELTVMSDNAAPEGWGVQLGSFRDTDATSVQEERIKARARDLVDGLNFYVQPTELSDGRGRFYRLIVGAYSDRGTANALCDSFKDRGIDCLVRRHQ